MAQPTVTVCGGAGAHVLLCPFPASGHIIPLLDLARHLLIRGLTLTIWVTPANLPLLQPLLSSHPSSLQPLVLSPPEVPATGLAAKIRAFGELYDPILGWFRSHPSPPAAILSDFFLGWTLHLAREVGVPRIVFSPSSAFAIAVSNSIWRDLPKNGDPENANFVVSFPKVPNSPKYPWWQLSKIYRDSKEGDPDWEFFRNGILANMASWGVVFNSFYQLESVYIDHLKEELGHDRVWTVGPLLPPDHDPVRATNRGGSSSVPSHDVFRWLDKLADRSVVYVCFGSRCVLTQAQMNVLATGLELSGVHFIWCARTLNEEQTRSDGGKIPDGFEDRVVERGFVIKGWAPQVAILSHRAVGAFLTHCGWNSTLEGLVAGVVMLTWPMDSDQFTDAKFLVDQLGVGIRVGENTQNIPDSAQLAQILSESVDGSGSKSSRAMELSKLALEAVKGGSSSERDLDKLVETLSQLSSTFESTVD
ncbi:UDP-glycosyltransferase 89B2-like [Malania oleifera]|uniref:UDP-glycosyltransferase 89B2-like n=1 Tax=Malania oleifera TaxID=397392 RepID=UPI0025AE024B|nr:UDP-glycosyltransferase 89B2-like [Malania oleifera]